MRTRRRLTWLIFAICILAVLEGLGWVTWHALRLEKREREAQAATQFQQSIRLALWRMESEITPIIAAEASRPYFHYIPFYPAERAYTKMFQQVKPNEVLVPSPLLETSGRFIRLHYQVDPDGVVTSPQAPTGNMRDMAEAQYLDSEFIVLATEMLEEVAAMIRPGDQRPVAQLGAAMSQVDELRQQLGPPQAPAPPQVWQMDDSTEFKAREKAAQTAQTLNMAEAQRRKTVDKSESARDRAAVPEAPTTVTAIPSKDPRKDAAVPEPEASTRAVGDLGKEGARQSLLQPYQTAGPQPELNKVEQGAFDARWYSNPRTGEEELLLERPVNIDGRETKQGFWIDWPQLRERLAGSIDDLLPTATLCAATDASEAGQRLAAVPVRLLPGPMPPPAPAFMTPTHITLIVTWIAVFGAIGAIAVVLMKAMELSERRGRFVSAVTHELRTPLTTFCLYTEMLSDGMVPDEATRKQYLGTLKSESSRLARIVQNVLDYAGIGGVGRRSHELGGATSAAALLDEVRPSLDAAATRAGMQLETEWSGLGSTTIHADVQTLERILLNLVENACKYASDAADRRIQIRANPERASGRRSVVISVRDHGPGVPASERHRIFQAFHRAERDANGSKSGLGLGLALARELTSELGGTLRLNARVREGAEFRLVLPANS